MTDNLYLAKTMTLTSADSDVSSNYSLTAISGATAMSDGKAYDSNNATYGAYYTWNTAVASGNGSVCPKGWELPSTTLYQNLYGFYNSYTLMQSSSGPNMVLSGRRYASTYDYQNTRGFLWESNTYSDTRAHNTDLWPSNSRFNPADHSEKSDGYPVRCVAK